MVKEIKPLLKQLIDQYMHNTYGKDNDIEGWVKRMVENQIRQVGYDFVREMYSDALKKTIADSLEIIIRPKENI